MPDHAGILVGQRHRDHIPWLLLPQRGDPPPDGVRAPGRPAEDALRAADQNPSEVRVPALADAEQLGFAATRVLTWHQPEKRSEVTTIFEFLRRRDDRQGSRGGKEADPGDLHEAHGNGVGRRNAFELGGVELLVLLYTVKLCQRALEQEAEDWRVDGLELLTSAS